MNKKEMGITVKGLMDYVEICLDSECYEEIPSILNTAFSIAVAYDLKEIEKIEEDCELYRNMAKKEIREYIKKIEREYDKLPKLNKAYENL